MLCKKKKQRFLQAGSVYLLRLRAVLKVAHSADGFGLLAGVTVAFMEHLGVAFLSAPILGVLEAFKQRKLQLFYGT